ncbi:tetratricopeptide repeat protein [Isoptericola sp. 4D.3]|uniref:Tetratricopeptide repeat protein n=1 Tax=Isoptericola peretonis TaxID=2918523 RepID=A0ABT0J821_9MICO|nr:tetratricopeptide repeat protein [Isoptericola sp. 4D.3]
MTDAPRRRLPRGLAGAVAVTALLALYVWQIAGRGVAMIREGEPVLIAIGVAVLVIPLLVIVLIAREYRLATRVQRMADALASTGELPVDDLPRSPGGRIDRAAADAAFEERRAAVEESPDDWRAWYHLAFAYDAAGDRRRARETLRRASSMFRPGVSS